jgi:uncharacterized protein
MSFLKGLLLFLLLLYALFWLIWGLFQPRFLFFPDKLSPQAKLAFQESFRERWFAMSDGVKLHAVHFAARGARRGLILYLHGNAGSVANWGQNAAFFTRQGYDLIHLDYRGYGKSQGRIRSEAQLMVDLRRVYATLASEVSPEQLVLMGTSIGSGPAIQLAAERPPRLLILTSPYASLRRLVREKVSILPPWPWRFRFESERYLPQVTCPVVLLHGQDDRLIPPAHAQRLKAVHPAAELYLIPERGHADVYRDRAYAEVLKTWLTKEAQRP